MTIDPHTLTAAALAIGMAILLLGSGPAAWERQLAALLRSAPWT